MKKLNFNIKDRKVLTLGLCLVLVCVFTLTVAYSALSAVLTINGNARVSAADWDIYLDKPRVNGGSATTDVPIVNGVTATFNTTLNMPGDFYEFVVDVVNDGSIDAMIENVVKTPELTTDQAKFLKYEITYQNGESITTKQLLAKDTTMPIKVRIEYRSDLVSSDLPAGQVVLDLSLTLEYTQSDGTGSSVAGDGKLIYANGDIDDIGTIVTIGTEQFYTFGTEGSNVKLLSMYNLMVGNEVDISEYGNAISTPLSNSTGLQSSDAIGVRVDENGIPAHLPWVGTVAFATEDKHGINYSDYSGSLIETYVNDYEVAIETMGVNVELARLITKDELVNTFGCSESEHRCIGSAYPWIYATTYWSGSTSAYNYVWRVGSIGNFDGIKYAFDDVAGVRPVIIISKSAF